MANCVLCASLVFRFSPSWIRFGQMARRCCKGKRFFCFLLRNGSSGQIDLANFVFFCWFLFSVPEIISKRIMVTIGSFYSLNCLGKGAKFYLVTNMILLGEFGKATIFKERIL